jgi:hypothetical protein
MTASRIIYASIAIIWPLPLFSWLATQEFSRQWVRKSEESGLSVAVYIGYILMIVWIMRLSGRPNSVYVDEEESRDVDDDGETAE